MCWYAFWVNIACQRINSTQCNLEQKHCFQPMRSDSNGTSSSQNNGWSRAVHGSGGSGLCPTHNRPAGDRVGRCPTCNWLAGDRVLQVGFPSGEHRFQVKLKPTGNHQKKEKITEISPDPSKIRCDLAGFGKDFAKSDAFSPKLCRESSDLVFWSPKSVKSWWKTRRKAWIRSGSFSLRAVGLNNFWRRGPKTEPSALGFGARDLCPTTGVVGSGCSRSGTGGLGGWAGEMDSPRVGESILCFGNTNSASVLIFPTQ